MNRKKTLVEEIGRYTKELRRCRKELQKLNRETDKNYIMSRASRAAESQGMTSTVCGPSPLRGDDYLVRMYKDGELKYSITLFVGIDTNGRKYLLRDLDGLCIGNKLVRINSGNQAFLKACEEEKRKRFEEFMDKVKEHLVCNKDRESRFVYTKYYGFTETQIEQSRTALFYPAFCEGQTPVQALETLSNAKI